ncbi:MAG: hypothetical protein JWO98_3868 [Frankiales bacterium]|nr:hypothetical protein [Frankiales bacterium]
MTAVILALLSATAFSISMVVQHRAATQAGAEHGGNGVIGLVLRLLRTRAWLAGQGAAVAGFTLHALAVSNGPVILVQPLLSFTLVFALGLGALVDRRHPDRPLPGRREWRSAAVVILGLVLFLVAARPHHGRHTGRPVVLLSCWGAALLLAVLAVAYGRRRERPHRALVFGVAAGCGFGMTGVLLKQVVHHAPTSWPTIWPLLALLVSGATAIVCAQSGYQAGRLIESLPTMTVLEPIVAACVAALAYRERFAGGWLPHLGQLAGLVMLTVGVIGIARAETARAEREPEPVLLP